MLYIYIIRPVGVRGPPWKEPCTLICSSKEYMINPIIADQIYNPMKSMQFDHQYSDLNGHHNWVCRTYAFERVTTNQSDQTSTGASTKYYINRYIRAVQR